MSSQAKHTTLLVDGHVHIHDCFDLSQFLAATYKNFSKQAKTLGSPSVWAILLTEIQGVNAFSNLVNQQDQLNQQLQDWTIESTDENTSLRLKHTSGQLLLILAGRQIVTQEKIEVLALLTDTTIPDGLPLPDTLAKVTESHALPVLPWGVGKWIGSRGTLVEQQFKAANFPLFIGDNGGSPSFWPLPKFCQQQPQLPGTDPLPLTHETHRAGSFGFSPQGP